MLISTTPATPLQVGCAPRRVFLSRINHSNIRKINHMTQKYYAHTLDGKLPYDWQPLEEHPKNVAEMARLFADVFGAGDWGYLAWL